MYSLSQLAKMRGWGYEYYVDHIAEYLKENPQGNYQAACANGMIVKEQRVANREQFGDDVLFIEEGGRQKESEYGIKILAEEIIAWQHEQGIERLAIFLPSGTGTTALYLQKNCSLLTTHCSFETKVFTTPCVGKREYLKKQFLELETNEAYHPTILTLEKKHHFGKLYKDHYKIWLKLQQQTGVEFDLLYDPLGWRVLLEYIWLFESPVLYIHQGGVLGNKSMLPRYQRKFPLESEG